jgi:plastocyanin
MNAFQCLFVSLVLSLTASMHAGSIVGTVSGQGKSDSNNVAGGRYDSRKYKFVEKVNYAELRDFVVFLEGKMTNALPSSAMPQKVVTQKQLKQKDAMFRPHVLPVFVGTTVQWPNEDDILHNVFSMSEPKPFDLDLYKGNPPEKAVTFDRSGRVDVFCSIHSQMHCIVLVLENPFFATADAQGRYAITNVPAGVYKLKAWHERLPAQAKEITVPETGEVRIDFVLGVNNLPKY